MVLFLLEDVFRSKAGEAEDDAGIAEDGAKGYRSESDVEVRKVTHGFLCLIRNAENRAIVACRVVADLIGRWML